MNISATYSLWATFFLSAFLPFHLSAGSGWASTAQDTIQPPFPDFVCDVVCPEFQANWITVDADCGQSNGRAEVIPVGFPEGTSFTFVWEGGVADGPIAENLPAGIYEVSVYIDQLVQDQSLRNCALELEVIVGNKQGPDLTVNSVRAGSCENFTGNVRLGIEGGAPPYSIDYGFGNGGTLSTAGEFTANGLVPGDYTFLVTDANGCISAVRATVSDDGTSAGALTLNGEVPSACGLSDGSLTVTINEGQPPYTIRLNDLLEVVSTTNTYTFQGLSSGLYTVEVAYSFFCTAVEVTELNVSCPPSVQGWSSNDANCPDGIGYLSYDGNGLANEYFQVRQLHSGFVIATIPGDEAAIIEVMAGDYEIRRVGLEDDCICEFLLTVEQPEPLQVQLEVTPGACEPGNITPAAIVIDVVQGGTAPYALFVTDESGQLVDDPQELAGGTYTVRIEDSNGCSVSTELDILAPGIAGVGILQDTINICPGDVVQPNIQVAELNGLQFEWTPAQGISDPTIAEPFLSPDVTTTYILAITDPSQSGVCATLTDTLTVIVADPLNLAIEGNTFLCEQEAAVVTAFADVAATFQWFRNGILAESDNDNTFEVLPSESQNNFSVIAFSQDGCSDTLNFEMDFQLEEPFTLTVSASDSAVCIGETVLLSANIIPTGLPTVSVEWYDELGALIGTGSQVAITPSEGVQAFEARAIGQCNTLSEAVSVTAFPEGRVSILPGESVVACTPQPVTLSTENDWGGLLVWTDLTGQLIANTATLEVFPLEGGASYIATVPALDCITPDTVTVTLEEVPVLPDNLQDTFGLCVGEELRIDLSGYGPDYTWTGCDGSPGTVSGDELIVVGTSSGEQCYTFEASNGCGTSSLEVRVFVVSPQQLEALPDTTVLACAPVSEELCFTASGAGLPVRLLEWTDAAGTVLGSGGELCVAPPAGEHLYIVSAPGLSCITSDTVRVLVEVDIPPKPAALPDTLKYCVGDSGGVVLEDYSFAYFWENEAGDIVAENGPLNIPTADAGTFAFYFEAYNGCGSFRDTLTVFVVEEGAIVIQPDETIVVCNDDPLTLTVNAPLADCVVWLDDNGTVIDTAAQVTVSPMPGNNVYIATLPGLACVTADTAEVVFIPDDFEVQVNASAAEVCLGSTVSLSAAILPPNNVTVVTWYDSAFNFLGEGLSIEATPTFSGIQTYIAVAENGCTVDTAMLDILVEELMLDLSASAETICNGEEVTLSVSGCDDCTYSWAPEGTLSAPDMAITQAFPDVTTTYEVIVAGAVCTDTLSTVVTVEECLDCNVDLIFIADAFTPDGDGNNDLVCVRSEVLNQFESVELMIYNRWGQEVYQSEEMSSLCWDGTFAGEALPPDVYGYVLRIVCPPTETQPRTENVLKGNITLLR